MHVKQYVVEHFLQENIQRFASLMAIKVNYYAESSN